MPLPAAAPALDATAVGGCGKGGDAKPPAFVGEPNRPMPAAAMPPAPVAGAMTVPSAVPSAELLTSGSAVGIGANSTPALPAASCGLPRAPLECAGDETALPAAISVARCSAATSSAAAAPTRCRLLGRGPPAALYSAADGSPVIVSPAKISGCSAAKPAPDAAAAAARVDRRVPLAPRVGAAAALPPRPYIASS